MVPESDVDGETTGRAARHRPLLLTFALGKEAGDAILRSTEGGLYDAFIRGSLLLRFDGASPLRPGTDRRTVEGGALSEVPLLPFLWALAAGVSRMARRASNTESVDITSTGYALALDRQDERVRIRLMEATADRKWVQRAETRATTTELGEETARALGGLLVWILFKNPVLRGNLQIRRMLDTVRELEKTVRGDGE